MPDVRPYASFWEWYGEHRKQVKEAGVMADFLYMNESRKLVDYADVLPVETDPPDFHATSGDGKRIAVEITELVSEQAIRANVKAQDEVNRVLPAGATRQERAMALLRASKYKEWTNEEVLRAIQERLQSKDKKQYKGYDEVHVILHVDEPTVPPEEYIPLVEKHEFEAMRQVARAFILFSPVGEDHPAAELRIAR